VEKPSALFPSI
jgi:hypothetical protein